MFRLVMRKSFTVERIVQFRDFEYVSATKDHSQSRNPRQRCPDLFPSTTVASDEKVPTNRNNPATFEHLPFQSRKPNRTRKLNHTTLEAWDKAFVSDFVPEELNAPHEQTEWLVHDSEILVCVEDRVITVVDLRDEKTRLKR